jgi:O-antigen/teichoic acid export membrane protein
MILMGQERIRSYNFISLLQVSLLILVLLGIIFVDGRRDVLAYIFGLYCSYTFAFLLSFFMVIPKVNRTTLAGSGSVLKEILRYGSVMQFGNLFQLFNYRLSYYFIEAFLNRASVGIYSIGVQLSEGIWLISKSISMVQYSRISNEKDQQYAIRLTLSLVRISFIVTLLVLAFILMLPSSFFTFIFGKEFAYVKMTIASLSAGILILSVSITISPLFSGIGKPHHNTISAAIGLVFTIIGGYILIPRIGLLGAGLSASVSYTVATFYQIIVFVRFAKLKMKDLLITQGEITLLRNEVRRFLKKG